ncbi:MAG: hypothetical protein Q7T72_02245 [Bacteroidales bacterium]|nr:hypothetical protein [Bacteroidales bacterium]
MKQEFDIHKYREIEEIYIEKLKYINHCIREAEKISVRQTINELKFIRLQIYEYCSLSMILVPQNIPTNRKGITIPDAAILNYVNEKINYYSEFEKININVINKPDTGNNKKEKTFESLFFKPQLAIEVKRILKENEYLNDSGQWISSGKLKRIALPYYVLKDEVNEFGFIRSGEPAKQLKTWCKEFGVITSYDKGSEPSLKGLLNRPGWEPEKKKDYIEFLRLFEPLKEK